MSIPTAGSMLADLLEAMKLGITPEELNKKRLALKEQIEHQSNDPSVKITAEVFLQVENKNPEA